MNKPYEQKANGAAPAPDGNEPGFTPVVKPGPDHNSGERASMPAPAPAAPAKDAPRAAKGNDEVMSQQQQQGMPSSTDEVKGMWKQKVGAAKVAWGKLTEDELLQAAGHQQKLSGLVQERYAVTREEADKQVKAFFDKN